MQIPPFSRFGRATRSLSGLAATFLVIGFMVLAALAQGATLPPTQAHGATLQPFENKAAFLAATGATNATGPLPNLGLVADSGNPTSTTVGAVTFSILPSGNSDSLFIGANGTSAAPDFYPQTPGNDLALGYESFQVTTAAPVHSFGFEMVEPNLTMPPGGGTPVASPYLITLLRGTAVIGQFVMDVPDDTLGFVGVWSDTAFDRVTIVDSTGNDDNEFFAEFYTGTVAAPSRSFTPIAGTGTAVPGGSGGVFTRFEGSATISSRVVSFLGLGSTGSLGIYSRDSALPQDPLRVADLSTAIPGGAGTFTSFSGLAASGSRLSFLGAGAGQAGIYVGDSASPQDPLRVADLSTAIPNGTGNFTAFTVGSEPISPKIVQETVAFFGAGASGQQGVYARANNSLVRLADTATAIPSGTGLFTGFGDYSLCPVNARRISFHGLGSGGQQGLYNYVEGSLSVTADTATPIPDGVGTFTGFRGLSIFIQDPTKPNQLAFVGLGTAGQQGVYVESGNQLKRIADLNTPIPGGAGTFTGFGALSGAAAHNAFIGFGSLGQKGIYLASGLTEVIAVGDMLAGKEIADLRFGPTGLTPGGLAYIATFKDSSEGVFVADLVHFPFSGFHAPVANLPQVNQAKAGQSIPIQFGLEGFQGFDIFAAGYPKSEPIAPVSGEVSAISAVAPGASGLSYDAVTDRYTWVWKTEKSWAGTSRQLLLKLKDGATYRASFRFK